MTTSRLDRMLIFFLCAWLTLPTLGCLGMAALAFRNPERLWPLLLFAIPAIWGTYTTAALFGDTMGERPSGV